MMAARFRILLCLLSVFSQLIPRSQPLITKQESSKNLTFLLNINGESISLGKRNFLPIPGLYFRPALKRIDYTVHGINYPISENSKHGNTALILPGRLFWSDLTIHMDIQSNPGPERLENHQIKQLRSSDNNFRNLNNRALSLIKYSRSGLPNMRASESCESPCEPCESCEPGCEPCESRF